MVLWHCLDQLAVTFKELASRHRAQFHAVGGGGVETAKVDEYIGVKRIRQELQHPFVVVAEQRYVSLVRCLGAGEKVENLARLRPAIDIISKVNDAPVSRTITGDLVRDHFVQGGQAVEAAMYVADSIKAHAIGSCRFGKVDA